MLNIYKLCAVIGSVLLFALPYSMQAKEGVSVPMIVGGQPADPGEYPFMVALMKPDESDQFLAQYCGGILIDPEWVLTTANCALEDNFSSAVTVEERESIDIGLGFHDLSDSPDAERIASGNIYVHPDFDTISNENDIALIQLSSPVTGYSLAQYATNEAQNSAGTSAIAIGWGLLSEASAGGMFSAVLHEVDVPIVANEDCNAWGFDEGEITADMLCAGYREGGKDACDADAGGPLFYYEDGLPIVVGVISWGRGCARPDFPGVYARVSYFADWIDSHISVPNDGTTPSAVTLNGSQTGVKMSRWALWVTVFGVQSAVLTLVLYKRKHRGA